MMFPSFDWEKCIGCIACVRTCRGGALRHSDRGGIRTITFEPGLCDGDLLCVKVCPVGAIKPSPKSRGSSATFPLARCENCGKLTDFTVKEVEWGKRTGFFDVFLCPDCRRVESARKIGEGVE